MNLKQQGSRCQRRAAASARRLPAALRRVRPHQPSGHTCLHKPKVHLKPCLRVQTAALIIHLNQSDARFGAARTRRAQRAQRRGGRSARLRPLHATLLRDSSATLKD